MAKQDTHKCLIIACGALAREIIAVRKQLGISDETLTLQCLPAEYHNTPQKIVPALEKILAERRSQFDTVLIGYGDCGTGGALDRLLEKYDATRMPGAHCYEFFAGAPLFEEIVEEELGSFFLTDYLLKNFDRLIIQGLGLDRYPHLRDAYFEHYRQVVYLAQTEDSTLLEKARAAAERLKLDLVVKNVGYGDIVSELSKITDAAPFVEAP